jgi:thioredoxin 1
MGAGIVRIVTDASFDEDVLQPGRTVLVAFGAPWCGPCHLMSSGLRALASQRRDRLRVAKLDVDANPATTDRYGVETFPVCILFRDGKELARLDGYMPLRKIETLLSPWFEPAGS